MKQSNIKTALVLGAGGFIGSHIVKKLKNEGYWVRGVDLKFPEYEKSDADEFLVYDLRDAKNVEAVIRLEANQGYPLKFQFYKRPFVEEIYFDEVYQFAADMGGAGYISTGENDANIMHNSLLIDLNVANQCVKQKVKRICYASTACVYPEINQLDSNNPNCEESSTYPANPDSEYGWQKLISERVYLAFSKNYGLNVRIARFHNIYGPFGTYKGGKEKAPAAICRKVIETNDMGELEVWGDGTQTRSFLYIDACIDKVIKFMRQDSFSGPVNIGSEEMVTINELAEIAIKISKKNISIKNITGDEFLQKYGYSCPIGVKGRNSNNRLYREKMGYDITYSLEKGITKTYEWIKSQIL